MRGSPAVIGCPCYRIGRSHLIDRSGVCVAGLIEATRTKRGIRGIAQPTDDDDAAAHAATGAEYDPD
jgi:hypothetical protein